MRTKELREDTLIQRFCSAYENGSWAGEDIFCPDLTMPGGVDAFVTRSSDGRTLAIEHTLIEPFQRDKEDFVSFEEFFLEIENDKSLTILGHKYSYPSVF
ncbi:hypothetical protein RBB75_01940 [Tunturibacter empetritectus]|uniref:Uncharacterized protein n=1 Tax=Tunturiibacter empetritectus TaxID=3069691 RepID=A0AAU7ZED0_9BACT